MSTPASAAEFRRSNLSLFALLMLSSIVAIAAMCPALLFLLDPARQSVLADESTSPVSFVIGFAVANIILSAIAITIGLSLEPSVRMGVPVLRSAALRDPSDPRPPAAIVRQCCLLGLAVAATALVVGVVFRSHLPGLPENFEFPPIWQGSLMMLGAAVREEILFRLFALNLFVWIGTKIARLPAPTAALIWTANLLVALLFAVLHLVPAAQLLTLNAVAAGVSILLATVAGMVFGWVYWRNGLLLAILTHAICSLTLYLGARGVMAVLS